MAEKRKSKSKSKGKGTKAAPKAKGAGSPRSGAAKPAAKASGTPTGTTRRREDSLASVAAGILKDVGEPMRCVDIIKYAEENGLWTRSPIAKTPQNTLHAQISTEIKKAAEGGASSRFKKVGRGQFALA